jgi:hypothetical protein
MYTRQAQAAQRLGHNRAGMSPATHTHGGVWPPHPCSGCRMAVVLSSPGSSQPGLVSSSQRKRPCQDKLVPGRGRTAKQTPWTRHNFSCSPGEPSATDDCGTSRRTQLY